VQSESVQLCVFLCIWCFLYCIVFISVVDTYVFRMWDLLTWKAPLMNKMRLGRSISFETHPALGIAERVCVWVRAAWVCVHHALSLYVCVPTAVVLTKPQLEHKSWLKVKRILWDYLIENAINIHIAEVVYLAWGLNPQAWLRHSLL